MSRTRAQLRRDIARRLGDLRTVVATSDGQVDVFYDNVNLIDPAQSFRGRHAWVVSATNAQNVGLLRRVSGNSPLASALTLQPALPAITKTGDVLDLFNNHGNQGWGIPDIHDAINRAIDDAGRLHRVELVEELTGVLPVTTSPTAVVLDVAVAIPPDFTDLASVEWKDTDGNWWPLAYQRSRGWSGWWLDGANRQIWISAADVPMISGGAVQLRGYGRPSPLNNDADRTTIPAEWIVERCVADLLDVGGNANHPEQMQQAFATRRRADAIRARIRTRTLPGMISIGDVA